MQILRYNFKKTTKIYIKLLLQNKKPGKTKHFLYELIIMLPQKWHVAKCGSSFSSNAHFCCSPTLAHPCFPLYHLPRKGAHENLPSSTPPDAPVLCFIVAAQQCNTQHSGVLLNNSSAPVTFALLPCTCVLGVFKSSSWLDSATLRQCGLFASHYLFQMCGAICL